MSEGTNGTTVRTHAPGWVAPAILVLGIVAAAGLVFGWEASTQLESNRQAMSADLKTVKQGVDQDVTALKDRIATDEKANSELQSDLSVVTKRLRITQGQLKTAREEAAKLHEEATEKITALDTSVHSELATKAGADDLRATNGQVSEVRGDLDTAKKDLQMTRSEFGTLIARNHDDVEQLRRLGERDYIEFTLTGKNKPQKVGNVTVSLRSVNQKRNQFNVNLVVEDKTYEKKNRATNEPIFFYMTGTRLPEELVVNKVGKDTITGYVSIPKANQMQPASSGSSGQ